MSNQSKLVFYGAISLDGYLARENHELDWLFGTEGEEETGYQEFYESVDIILMGRNTYDQISILSPDKFPYEGKPCYVFSRTLTGSIEHVTFINEDIVGFTQSLKEQEGKRIWIVGGEMCCSTFFRQKLWMSSSFKLPQPLSAGVSHCLWRGTEKTNSR